jgi:hypothetical protein
MFIPHYRTTYRVSRPPRKMPTAPSSPLLRLPGELRNEIYAYALCGHLFGRPQRLKKPVEQHTTSLLLVCRQIHNEARDFLFKNNTFLIHCSDRKSSRRTSPPGYSFESLNQKQRELVRSVRLNLADFELYKLSIPVGDEGESIAADESEAEALRVVKGAYLDLLEDLRGSVRMIEVAAVAYCWVEECREKRPRSSEWRRAMEWLEREIYRRVEGVEVRFIWVASVLSFPCVHF